MTKTVMLVEDELLVAFDVQDIIEAAGFAVDGPYVSVAEALEAVDRQLPACAVLDVQLQDGEVYPAADLLQQAGIPLVFHSGHADAHILRTRYPSAAVCGKPCSPTKLKATIADLLEE
jgi:FixJ family two-component response regulator